VQELLQLLQPGTQLVRLLLRCLGPAQQLLLPQLCLAALLLQLRLSHRQLQRQLLPILAAVLAPTARPAGMDARSSQLLLCIL
jgi:hypothetical protein